MAEGVIPSAIVRILMSSVLRDTQLGARGLDALANLGLGESPGLDDVADVRLRDDLGRKQQSLNLVAPELRVREVRQGQSGSARVGARDQGDGELGGSTGFELDVLEDRHALLAVEDVLQALDAGVLPGDDDVAGQPVALEDTDDSVGDVVVGRENALDLSVSRGQRPGGGGGGGGGAVARG